ncbi:CE1759 family FMN reductase [Calidifontibacter terrae]
MKLVVVSAGLRNPSSTKLLADQLAASADRALGGVDVRHVEVRDHAHAVVDALMTGFATGALKDALDDVTSADALILVTPTFQASYAGLFKSFIDLIEEGSLRGTPTLLAATGGSERHSLMLDHTMRPLVAHLGALAVPTAIFAATSDFGAPALDRRVDRATSELATLIGGATVRRPAADPFTDITPFEELLNR